MIFRALDAMTVSLKIAVVGDVRRIITRIRFLGPHLARIGFVQSLG
jgi:hypothetical protein